jgi:hypothetical protein
MVINGMLVCFRFGRFFFPCFRASLLTSRFFSNPSQLRRKKKDYIHGKSKDNDKDVEDADMVWF